MQQLTFTDAEYNLRKKKTRREEFLDTMDQKSKKVSGTRIKE